MLLCLLIITLKNVIFLQPIYLCVTDKIKLCLWYIFQLSNVQQTVAQEKVLKNHDETTRGPQSLRIKWQSEDVGTN